MKRSRNISADDSKEHNLRVIEGITMGNYPGSPGYHPAQIKTGVIVVDPTRWDKWRHSFHPYDGSKPVHCALGAAGRTYYRTQGYS